MDHSNINTESRKNKNLNYEERITIQLRLKDGLTDVKNTDLPMKLRRNTKLARVKKHKKNLGTSISQRPIDIDNRTEFGHWEIDTVIGEKTKDDNVLLTIVERKTRYAMVLKAIAKTAPAITDALNKVRDIFGEQFSQVFKSITSDNGSEFADLSTIETEANTKIYFTHPYSSFEKVLMSFIMV